MSDEDALLAAIAANPDEDTPRLAYADWLDENATTEAQRARASFIRAEIEAANLYVHRARFPEEYQRLRAGAKALQERYAGAWLAELTDAPVTEPKFYRGFLSRLELGASECARAGRPRWHREPLAHVVIRGGAAAVRPLCGGWLDGVRDLEINPVDDPDTDAIAEALAASECASLRRLQFWSDALTDRGLRALAGGAFHELTYLSLFGPFTPPGWSHLLNAPLAARVTELTVGHRAPWQTADANRPGPGLADAIVGAPVHSQLEFLWVCHCGLGGDGAFRLARGRFDRLKTLDIDNDALDAGAVHALASGHFPALTDMRLSECGLTDDVFAPLTASPLVARLERLDVSVNELTAASVAALVAGRAARLKELNMSFNSIGDAGATALAATALPALEELNLSSTHLTDAGANAIAGAPWAGQLKSLFLGYNDISEAKADELVARFGPILWIASS